ncbi:hypothetical protein [Brevibacillus migulae]|uniref:hypothetical protein n=1 Tax=Brevibacillus migulae TaxID=1644114 RepID=UPI001F15B224|nr:hypothetical protein [Brevibacillus migulae]
MRDAGLGVERILERLARLERLSRALEQREPERHVKKAIKEWLLASRSVIDSLIDTLEEEQDPPSPRKIKISSE